MLILKMPNILQKYPQQWLYYQFKFMLASIKKSGVRLKDSVVKARYATYRWMKKHRKKLIAILVILLAIGLTVGLILAAFHGVEITNYGVIINYTEQKIFNGTYNNEVHLIGLNSIYFMVPKRKFLIYFEEAAPFNGAYWSPKLTVRSTEGTKMLASARVSCQIRLNSALMKDFLQEYGLNWQTYVIEKSKNSIIQNIASTAFYEINNTLLLQKINTEFFAYYNNIANYPFTFKIISLKIEYPTNSFSATNSLGIRLLGEKSVYSQLVSNYENLNGKVVGSIGDIQDISARIGAIQGQISMMEMQVRSLDANWMAGMEVLNRLFEGNTVQIRRFVWLYFQKVYNSTYNNYTLY